MVTNERETSIYGEVLEKMQVLEAVLDEYLMGEGAYSKYAQLFWQGRDISLGEFRLLVESYQAMDIEAVKRKATLQRHLEKVTKAVKDILIKHCGNGDEELVRISIAKQGVVSVLVRGIDLPAIRQSGVNPHNLILDDLDTLQSTIGHYSAQIESRNMRRWRF